MYLAAVMDWHSRHVLSWRLSNSLDATFCLDALEDALSEHRPDIFNTDQGSQFTSEAFTSCLQRHGVAISMDGRGRALDNVFIERLWRTLKYEEIYLKDYPTSSIWNRVSHGTSSSTAANDGTKDSAIARHGKCSTIEETRQTSSVNETFPAPRSPPKRPRPAVQFPGSTSSQATPPPMAAVHAYSGCGARL